MTCSPTSPLSPSACSPSTSSYATYGAFAPTVTRTLDSHACRLRRKLLGHGVEMVTNVWGIGYCLTRA